jgi:hypothetical protein
MSDNFQYNMVQQEKGAHLCIVPKYGNTVAKALFPIVRMALMKVRLHNGIV